MRRTARGSELLKVMRREVPPQSMTVAAEPLVEPMERSLPRRLRSCAEMWGRYGRDMGEIWARWAGYGGRYGGRYGGDMVEMWGRYGGDIGEI